MVGNDQLLASLRAARDTGGMNEKRETPFVRGDRVTVVDGTLDEARRIGGENPLREPYEGYVWVVLTIFERPTAVYLMEFQMAKS